MSQTEAERAKTTRGTKAEEKTEAVTPSDHKPQISAVTRLHRAKLIGKCEICNL